MLTLWRGYWWEPDRPLSPKAISQQLGQHGREGDRPELVSAVLNYLRKRGRAYAPEHGVWLVSASPTPSVPEMTADDTSDAFPSAEYWAERPSVATQEDGDAAMTG